MIRIAIVDDERSALDLIGYKMKIFLDNLKYEYVMDYIESGEEFLKKNEVLDYNIVFLDLEMPEMNGLETAKLMRQKYPNIILVIITNRDDLVFDTFQYDVSAFIRKSNLDKELEYNIQRIYHKAKNKITSYVFKTNIGNRSFTSTDITFFESHGHDIYLHQEHADPVKILSTLEKLEVQLSSDVFVRCHAGYIVNCNYIFSINKSDIKLLTNELIPLSRNRKKYVKDVFHRFVRCI